MNQSQVREIKKANREEALEMAQDTKTKLLKLIFSIDDQTLEANEFNVMYQSEFNATLTKVQIWLNRYIDSYNREAAIDTSKLPTVTDVKTIHDDNLKIDYRINYLSSIAARLISYGEKATDGEQTHSILKALDYIYECIGYLELMK